MTTPAGNDLLSKKGWTTEIRDYHSFVTQK